jgi:hypothetical protein
LYKVEEPDLITFGNKYQYNATSALTYNKNKNSLKGSTLSFLSKAAEKSESEFNNAIEFRKMMSSDKLSKGSPKKGAETARAQTVPTGQKPFHRTVNSLDLKSSQGVKGKQIMFYSDLVD